MWILPNLLRAQIEQKCEEMVKFSLLDLGHPLSPDVEYLCSWFADLQTWTGTTLLAFLGVHIEESRNQLLHNQVSQFNNKTLFMYLSFLDSPCKQLKKYIDSWL